MITTVDPGNDFVAQRLRSYCDFALGTLGRADQRRWAEVYIRGLLFVEGRRSIKRIASDVGNCSDQSLQQFINQSPWDPEPVRQRIASLMADLLKPMAWVVDEVAFTKHGRHSAAIERQYVPSRGRVSNCQLGSVTTLAGNEVNAPVNWRLTIPRSWDTDATRRARAHIPSNQRHQPHWRYQVEMLDDMSGDWGIPLVPVVLDARYSKPVHSLFAELDNRRLDYLVEVTGDTPLRSQRPVSGLHHRSPNGRSKPSTPATLAQLIQPEDRTTVTWRTPVTGHSVRSQFATIPVEVIAPAQRPVAGAHRPDAPKTLLIEWALGGNRPRGYWLSNMIDRAVEEFAALAKVRLRAQQNLKSLPDSLGLGHHEGRSYVGWHHHVTLVSVAHAFQVLHSLRAEEEPIVPRVASTRDDRWAMAHA